MYRLFPIFALLVAANAGPVGHATSFVSFNDNHNSVQHIQSAPAQVKYAAPAPSHYSAPSQYSAPSHYSVPSQYTTSSQYSAPVQSHYAAPAVAKIAVPVVAKIAAPAASSYYSAPSTSYSSPVVAKYASSNAYAEKEEQYGPAKYQFAYIIQDPHTGDYHSQEEKRDGDHVVGQYSLHEADGTVRLVKYSDDGHGFNAIVERQGQPNHPAPAPAAYKAIAAPQYQNHY